ncbi:helix-turn-helix domain-containing protein [Francisella philomiragia]|uniref:Helix-turn-helix domain-containing protein n=1 Tax=Francisella philomiragia TaxID=28110 RepID=A0ABS1GEJ6_9GAMM|nr:helix-turn-helix domain-containing protein [Francisella philomiragia]MBK2259575.1 helix-turn-helix domain-containing protein [Francisella philomiragia]MBK2303267.1 helix-turn-helix domain-containing protein [Francisella philomiragia]
MISMKRIQIESKKQGYTQETLAEAMGVSRNAVNKWFMGTSNPTMARYEQLLELLGLDDNTQNINTQRTFHGDIANFAVGNNKGIVGNNNSNIAFGKNSNVSINSDTPSKDESLASIPVIKREDILDFKNAKRIDEVTMKLPADKHNKCFAFEYSGTDMRYDTNSMLPAYSHYSINDGSKIFVDISKDAINSLTSGDLVVCIADNKVNVRVLYNDGYDTTLMPLNSIAQNKDQNKELSKNKIVGRVFLIRFDRIV